MPFLPSWGSPTTVEGKSSSLTPQTIGPNAAVYPAQTFQNWAEQAFGRNELVYACVMEKATSMPEAPLRVYDTDSEDGEAELDDHPLRQLLANPNPILTEYELLELLAVHLDLAGVAFWEKVRDRAGRVVELWPLQPDKVRWKQTTVRGRTRLTYAYEVNGLGPVPLGEDVVHFRYPNPLDPVLGTPPMRAALRASIVDNEATDFVAALLQNSAVPGTIITTQQEVDQRVHDRLRSRWKQAFSKGKRGDVAVLQPGMEVHQLGLNLSDLEFGELRHISESRICMSFGVPPILVGANVGLQRSTFANYEEARRSFWHETIMPLQRRLAAAIERQLLPDVDPQGAESSSIELRFDTSRVTALQESTNEKWQRAREALAAGGITLNRFLAEVGEDPVEGGDLFYIPNTIKPVSVEQLPDLAEALTEQETEEDGEQSDDPSADDPADTPDEEDEEQDEDGKQVDYALGVSVAQFLGKAADEDASAPALPATASLTVGARRNLADENVPRVKRWAETLLKQIGSDAIAAVDTVVKALDESQVDRILVKIDAQQGAWVEEAAAGFEPILDDMVETSAKLAAAELGIHFDLENDEAAKFIETHAYRFAEGSVKTSADAIRKAVKESVTTGLSKAELRSKIADVVGDGKRAEMIARTETIRAANYGAKFSYEQAGVERITWLAAGDACPYCQDLDTKTISTRDVFLKDGTEYHPEGAARPMRVTYGDVAAPPAHPRCRCAIVANIE